MKSLDELYNETQSGLASIAPVQPEQKRSLFSSVQSGLQGFNEGVQGFQKGFGKSTLNTALNVGTFGAKLLPGANKESLNQTRALLGSKLAPKTPAEKAGRVTENIAELFVPIGRSSLLSQIGSSVGKLAARTALEAGELGAKVGAQTGSTKEAGKAATFGAIATPLFAGAGKTISSAAPGVGNIAASVLGSFIGKPPEVIKTAFQNPEEVASKIAQKVIPLEVRQTAIQAINNFKSKISKDFETGLNALKKESPTFLPSRTSGGQFSAVKNKMKELVQDSGIPTLFRKYSVSVNKGLLDFEKLNSNIVKGAEQTQLKQVFDTIRNQTDFSAQGVQRVASRINALSKFETSKGEVTSAVIGQIHNVYKQAIQEVYPELAKLRSVYETQKAIVTNIEDIIKSSKTNPTAVTGAVRKLSNLFNEDNDAYVKAVQSLERATGVDLMKSLAASEFTNLAPASFGSKMAQAGLLAGGVVYNPLILTVLPLFSPRVLGGLSTGAGKLFKASEGLGGALQNALPRTILPTLRERE